MPRAETTRGLEPGILAEARVAQAWFWDGYFARRGIDLQHRFGAEATTLTDLDVIGISFDPSLTARREIGEVKTGTSKTTPRPLDRALWLRGVRDLVGATSSEVTTAFRASTAVRDACRQLGSSVQHLEELTAREARLAIPSVNDCGSHGESMIIARNSVQSFVRSDPVLERAYWFLTSEVWFLEPFDALKRLLGLLRETTKRWPPDNQPEPLACARWIAAETIALVTLHLVTIAGIHNRMDPATFKETAAARLSTGDVAYHSIRKLSDRVDDYLAKILSSLDAPADVQVSAMGAFMPTPPDYFEPLLELVQRLAVEARTTSRLPRQMDVLIYERLVRQRGLSSSVARRLDIDADTQRQVRLIAAFLKGQTGVSSETERALNSPLPLPAT
ncbi:DNA-binding response regulator [Kineosporia sp. R_H_3]|uniref:DNA-binding response regulator n=1 Tax=Kineosporia sp. R_H_3 TaxID=1961848 RepID=UPI00117A9928|nr:DNA-binding response regulator [Kineosporia sp. R_H_3]